jgi:hypothetical protein
MSLRRVVLFLFTSEITVRVAEFPNAPGTPNTVGGNGILGSQRSSGSAHSAGDKMHQVPEWTSGLKQSPEEPE